MSVGGKHMQGHPSVNFAQPEADQFLEATQFTSADEVIYKTINRLLPRLGNHL